jgi:hypothetical protein
MPSAFIPYAHVLWVESRPVINASHENAPAGAIRLLFQDKWYHGAMPTRLNNRLNCLIYLTRTDFLALGEIDAPRLTTGKGVADLLGVIP